MGKSDWFADQRTDENIIWSPQPGAQETLVNCPITLIGFGGARGGGKTDGVLGKMAVDQERLGADFNAIFFYNNANTCNYTNINSYSNLYYTTDVAPPQPKATPSIQSVQPHI